VNVAMTVELDPGGRGHHMIIVERGNGDSVQSMILTDMEIGQLACLIENYRSQLVGHVSVEFADPAERAWEEHESERKLS
jgi:hypothetical protein